MKIDGQSVILNSFERAGIGWGETDTYPLSYLNSALPKWSDNLHTRIKDLEAILVQDASELASVERNHALRELWGLRYKCGVIENMAVTILSHEIQEF